MADPQAELFCGLGAAQLADKDTDRSVPRKVRSVERKSAPEVRMVTLWLSALERDQKGVTNMVHVFIHICSLPAAFAVAWLLRVLPARRLTVLNLKDNVIPFTAVNTDDDRADLDRAA